MQVLTASASGILLAQTPAEPTFRIATALVRLDIQVEDGDRLMKDFHPEDFIVYDEGRWKSND